MKGKGRCDEGFEGDSALRTPPLPCVKKSLVFEATWSRVMQCFTNIPQCFVSGLLRNYVGHVKKSCRVVIPNVAM